MKTLTKCRSCDLSFFSSSAQVLATCFKCAQAGQITCREDGKKRVWSEPHRVGTEPTDKEDMEGTEHVQNTEEEEWVFSCFLCSCTFPDFTTVQEQEGHLQNCTRDLEFKAIQLSQAVSGRAMTQEAVEEAEDRLSQDGLRGTIFLCVICGINISDKGIQTRCNHLKKCAKAHGVSTREVLQLIAPVNDEPGGDEESDNDSNDEEREEKAEETDSNATVIPQPPSPPQDQQPDSCCTGGSEVIDLCSDDEGSASASGGGGGGGSRQNTGAPTPAPTNNAFAMLMSGARSLASAAKEKEKAAETTIKSSSSSSSSGGGGAAGARKGAGRKGKAGGAYDYGGMRSQVNATPGWAPAYKKLQVGDMRYPIVVDGFQFAHEKLSDIYFLTHFHADHYIGLQPDFACGKIYCTETTARLVKLRLRLKRPELLVPLELEREYSIVVAGQEVRVTLCDANHCPGAALFLFHFKTGRRVLHTGDFRWDGSSMLRQSRMLRALAAPTPHVNSALSVYLDTTYCDANYAFPPQTQTIAAVVACVEREIAAEPSTLFVFGAYQIGKERVWMAVAERLDCKVHVDESRKKAIACFTGWGATSQARVSTKGQDSALWVRPMRDLNFNAMQSMRKMREQQTGMPVKRVVAFQPTGWSHSSGGGGGGGRKTKASRGAPAAATSSSAATDAHLLKERRNGPDSIIALPYSEHSSFTELVNFLKTFRPSVVVPTVNTQQDKVKSQLALLKSSSGVY